MNGRVMAKLANILDLKIKMTYSYFVKTEGNMNQDYILFENAKQDHFLLFF